MPDEIVQAERSLSVRDQEFVHHLVTDAHLIPSRAAELAGFDKHSGWGLMRRPKIKAAILAELEKRRADRDTIHDDLTAGLFSVDVADFGPLTRGEETVEEARERGVPTRFIKSIKTRTHTLKPNGKDDESVILSREVEVEFIDHLAVIDRLMKLLALGQENHKLTMNGPVQIIIERVPHEPRTLTDGQ